MALWLSNRCSSYYLFPHVFFPQKLLYLEITGFEFLISLQIRRSFACYKLQDKVQGGANE